MSNPVKLALDNLAERAIIDLKMQKDVDITVLTLVRDIVELVVQHFSGNKSTKKGGE